MSELHPTTEAEASELIRAAATDKTSLSLVGGGTRFALGRPMQTEKTLTSRKLTGITLYEPTEMIMAARAGTPLAEIQSALDEKNQMLAFEPMDHRRILGTDGEPTVGGMAAGNISGPRRLFGGAARDSLVGTRFVNGRGEIIKNGGRVMKNVTGLDLVRLLAGSWGTLGFLTEVTFKVQPRAPASMTLAIPDLGDADAVRLLCKAVGSPFEITGACHLPAGVGVDHGRTLIRIEGFPDSLAYRKRRLAELLSTSGELAEVDVDDATKLWSDVADAAFLAEPRSSTLWRLSVPPTKGTSVVAAIDSSLTTRHFFDWSGGLIWLAVEDGGDDGGAATVRGAIAASGGHASLVRGDNPLRHTEDVFHPQSSATARITAQLKKSFDPEKILNPGFMYAGV